jgi:hypothetical protein
VSSTWSGFGITIGVSTERQGNDFRPSASRIFSA